MPSTYSFDPTASNPLNLVIDEVHDLSGTVAAIPLKGAFYRKGLIVKGIVIVNGNPIVTVLREDADYIYSPLFLRPSAVTGIEAYSYILVKGEWESVKLTYQVVGGEQYVDVDLLTKVAVNSFDREDIIAWLSITGTESYNPRSRNPLLAQTSELEILNTGLERVNDSLLKLSSGYGDRATNAQVTALEVRQTALDRSHEVIILEWNGVKLEFQDIKEMFAYLENLILNGRDSNIGLNNGYVYVSEDPLSTHDVVHNLNTIDIDVTVWVLGEDHAYHQTKLINAQIQDGNTLKLTSVVPVNIMVIVRPVSVDGYGFIYESENPYTTHTIRHMLNSGFISACVWVEDEEGKWTWAVHPITILDSTKIRVPLSLPRRIRAIIQRPLPNAYIFKSRNAAITHRVVHELDSTHVGVAIWMQEENGTYTCALEFTTLNSGKVLTVTLNSSRFIKVVVQPADAIDATFVGDMNTKYNLIEDRLDTIQNITVNNQTVIRDIIDSGGGGTGGSTLSTFRFQSEIPAQIHEIIHDLDDEMVNIQLWVEHGDGLYYDDAVLTKILDNYTVLIELAAPANIRAKITRI